jgi:hypothetical protein
MTINKIQNSSPAFTGASSATKNLMTQLNNVVKESKNISKNDLLNKEKILNDIKGLAEKTKKSADTDIAERLKSSKFANKFDKIAGNVLGWFVGTFGKSKGLINKKKPSVDLARAVTTAVLLGNTFKEVVGTILYTTQALTNEDLPPDKRKFVGLYDLSVGVVSVIVSLVLGVGFQKTVDRTYANLLSPMKNNPKTGAIVKAAAGFTSFALQTIVGKRIIAPAIATPIAGKMKKNIIAKEEAKKAGNAQVQPSEIKKEEDVKQQKPAPAIATELPLNKEGYVDLKTYLDVLKEQQRQAE